MMLHNVAICCIVSRIRTPVCSLFLLQFVKPQVRAFDPLAQHVLAACLSDGPYSPLWDTEEEQTISFSVFLW